MLFRSDLTARINGEQANLAAEQAELEAYDRASKAQAQANEEATVDALTKRSTVTLSNPFTSMPASAISSGQ